MLMFTYINIYLCIYAFQRKNREMQIRLNSYLPILLLWQTGTLHPGATFSLRRLWAFGNSADAWRDLSAQQGGDECPLVMQMSQSVYALTRTSIHS